MIDHDYLIADAGTTITVAMTAMIAIAMTGTTIMIGMTMIGMTDTIKGIPVMIGATMVVRYVRYGTDTIRI